jgi:hypothetical protein
MEAKFLMELIDQILDERSTQSTKDGMLEILTNKVGADMATTFVLVETMKREAMKRFAKLEKKIAFMEKQIAGKQQKQFNGSSDDVLGRHENQ